MGISCPFEGTRNLAHRKNIQEVAEFVNDHVGLFSPAGGSCSNLAGSIMITIIPKPACRVPTTSRLGIVHHVSCLRRFDSGLGAPASQ